MACSGLASWVTVGLAPGAGASVRIAGLSPCGAGLVSRRALHSTGTPAGLTCTASLHRRRGRNRVFDQQQRVVEVIRKIVELQAAPLPIVRVLVAGVVALFSRLVLAAVVGTVATRLLNSTTVIVT